MWLPIPSCVVTIIRREPRPLPPGVIVDEGDGVATYCTRIFSFDEDDYPYPTERHIDYIFSTQDGKTTH